MGEKIELMTRGEVAQYTRMGMRTIDRWMARGWLTFIRLPNGHIRFRRVDVVNAMDRNQDARFQNETENDPSLG